MNLRSLKKRASYFLWALGKSLRADTSCPSCSNKATSLVKRKWLVTVLYRCPACHLLFRVPKDNLRSSTVFYQENYEEGFTTRMPLPGELELLLRWGFEGHEKDFRPYIDVLKAIGLKDGSLIFDYGASWGYGSWQLQKAGFKTIGHEIDPVRARYASSQLGVPMLADPKALPGPVDCFFSAHVIEHLPNPNILWETGVASLKRGGWLVAFMPNGDLFQASAAGGAARYHKLWGQAHPMLITPAYLRSAARKYGFDARVYSAPYALEVISRGSELVAIDGWELCVIAQRRNLYVEKP